MQPGGHITMLYVIPQRFGERIGTRLLYTMCTCAKDVYHQERITVHVLPMAAAPYFYHRGFGMIPNAAVGIFLPGGTCSGDFAKAYRGCLPDQKDQNVARGSDCRRCSDFLHTDSGWSDLLADDALKAASCGETWQGVIGKSRLHGGRDW